MSRTKAKQLFTVQDQIDATAGVECRKDADVIDALKEAIIEAVENQKRSVTTQTIQEAARQAARRVCNNELGKKPYIEVLVLRV